MTQAAQLLVRPEVNRAVARIMSGEHFTCLLLDDKAQRATALEAVLDKVADTNTRVAWVGNPLRSPLTVERFLIQIVGPEVDLRIERGPAELVKLITQPLGDESRVLVVVQQPETMAAEARDVLAGLPIHLAGSTMQVQFLFVGASTFTLTTFTEPAQRASPPKVNAAQPSAARFYVLLPVMLILGIALGIGIAMAPSGQFTHFLDRFSPQVTPAAALPRPAPDLKALRQEFDDFLAKRAATVPPMTDSQKESLFREFLTLHHRD